MNTTMDMEDMTIEDERIREFVKECIEQLKLNPTNAKFYADCNAALDWLEQLKFPTHHKL